MDYGLIGEKLGHSYSKIIHEKLADYQYDLRPLAPDELDSFMLAKDFKAINVTIPYKQEVIPYLDELHPHAKEIGAVNTIVNRDGKLYGFNTDYYGFLYMIEHNNIEIKDKKCLVLGNGGAAKAVIAVLKQLQAKNILLVSRRKSEETITYDECIQKHSDAQIIVNTTPVGMYPDIDNSPINLNNFHSCEAVLDIIYNPIKTKLTLQAEEKNIKALTGLEMLIAQAKKAVEYFLDIKLDDAVMEKIYEDLIKTLQ
jgi:shikimate dehydrogenase